MKRMTFSIAEGLLARAQHVADLRGVSLAEVLRGALSAYLDGPSAWDPPRSLGIADTGGAARGRDLGDLPEDASGRGLR